MKSFTFCYDDGGRSASTRPRQKADCVVKSHAIALRIPYDQAYDFMAGCGRESGHGFNHTRWESRLEKFLSRMPQENITAIGFIAKYTTGNYIVEVHKHAFAVIDGALHDEFFDYANHLVRQAWRVIAFPVLRVEPNFD